MHGPPSLTPAQESAVQRLRASERVLLTGHERPDGDCLGSQVALARVLEGLGARVHLLNPDPPEKRHAFLVSQVDSTVWEGGALPEHDLIVLLDAAEIERTGPLAEPLAASGAPRLVVDHHQGRIDSWWDEAFWDPRSAATGLLVRRIARALGQPLDLIAAQALFVALVTDTGWFRFGNVDVETLTVAGELIAMGIAPDVMYRRLHQGCSTAHPARVAGALDALEYHGEGRLAFVLVEGPAGRELDANSAEDVLDVLRAVGAVEVVLLLREVRPGAWKLSARSKTDYDVCALARHFGGGGHVRAAGATLFGSAAELRAQLVAAALSGFARGARA